MPLKVTSTPYFLIPYLHHSKMVDVKTSEMEQNLHQSTWDHEILYTDRSSKDEQLSV
jgi:hypothetical protein